MHKKSNTCTGKLSGKPLNEYQNKQVAIDHANYLMNGSVPYKCEVCKKYHLSPQSRITPSKVCACVDSKGMNKELYTQKKGAVRRAEILKAEQGVTLYVYKCHLGKGWHLTKNRR